MTFPEQETEESISRRTPEGARPRSDRKEIPHLPRVRVSIVIPAYNEKETIQEIIRRVEALPIEKEIIVVDDASTDGTREILKGLPADRVKVIYHNKNRGKGAALRTGFARASGEIVAIQDADLEYNPADFLRLISPIVRGEADVVYGSRFTGKPEKGERFHRAVNRFLTALSNLLTGLSLSDMETCYKVFKKEVLQDITIRSERFGFEPEITAKVAKRGYRIVEIPISYRGRNRSEGKKIGWKDGLEAIWEIIRFRFVD